MPRFRSKIVFGILGVVWAPVFGILVALFWHHVVNRGFDDVVPGAAMGDFESPILGLIAAVAGLFLWPWLGTWYGARRDEKRLATTFPQTTPKRGSPAPVARNPSRPPRKEAP